jgi:hypothetical protein
MVWACNPNTPAQQKALLVELPVLLAVARCSTILPLPYAMSKLGVIPGCATLVSVVKCTNSMHHCCQHQQPLLCKRSHTMLLHCTRPPGRSYPSQVCMCRCNMQAIVAYVNDCTCVMLVRAAAATQRFGFEALAEWAGGKRARMITQVSLILLLYGEAIHQPRSLPTPSVPSSCVPSCISTGRPLPLMEVCTLRQLPAPIIQHWLLLVTANNCMILTDMCTHAWPSMCLLSSLVTGMFVCECCPALLYRDHVRGPSLPVRCCEDHGPQRHPPALNQPWTMHRSCLPAAAHAASNTSWWVLRTSKPELHATLPELDRCQMLTTFWQCIAAVSVPHQNLASDEMESLPDRSQHHGNLITFIAACSLL